MTPRRLVRAEFGKAPSTRPISLWSQPRPMIDDLAGLVEATLKLAGDKPAPRVWVLSTDLSAQLVELQSQAVANVDDGALRQALAFEAEALSDINAFESRLGFERVGAVRDGHQNFWVTQMRSAEFDAVVELVGRSGARLMGIAHPAAISGALIRGDQAGTWRRVELWPENVLCLGGGSSDAGGLAEVMHSDPGGGRWEMLSAHWREQTGGDEGLEVLSAPDVDAGPMPAGAKHLALDDETVLGAWLASWANRFARGDAGARVIAPGKKPAPGWLLGAAAVALAAIVGGWCYWHHTWITSAVEQNRAELRSLNEPRQAFEAAEKRLREAHQRRAETSDASDALAEDVRFVSAAVEHQRTRVALLLGTLAESRPTNLAVRRLERDGMRTVVHGVSLTPDLPNTLAARLASLLGPAWVVDPPRKMEQETKSGVPVWGFELGVELVDLAEPPASLRPNAGEAGVNVASGGAAVRDGGG